MSRTTTPGPREARKQQTRQAMLDAALGLLEEQSLSSIGLREVTRAVGITPAAFYRHFRDIPDLGVALVDQALGSLHVLVQALLTEQDGPQQRIDTTVDLIRGYVADHPAHVRFVASERHGGVREVRQAIAVELETFIQEVADTLATDPGADSWSAGELRMLAGLFVDQMVQTACSFLSAELGEGPAADEVAATARDRMTLVELGRRHWRP
ncbi:HTH-type transcriptional repressor FabR [Streptomyces sp. YIM 130001]|uniref:TetR family transcriptional regulator n=1 Tax=Streptomyces sp. YIM 130001 TaxID=2259644 RepID=UPI000E65B958|nr:TetR family transcriptional regulator [Streptomyces sp. YIM 130001]RII20425.1 HTH-type transcriptional repressor FabR [Streptomyces sp. YIM 130001]